MLSVFFKGFGEGVFWLLDDICLEGFVFVIMNVCFEEMDDLSVFFGWIMGGYFGVIWVLNDDYIIVGRMVVDIVRFLI